jgi:hypothetical protein
MESVRKLRLVDLEELPFQPQENGIVAFCGRADMARRRD